VQGGRADFNMEFAILDHSSDLCSGVEIGSIRYTPDRLDDFQGACRRRSLSYFITAGPSGRTGGGDRPLEIYDVNADRYSADQYDAYKGHGNKGSLE
jgi:hypothetical protein